MRNHPAKFTPSILAAIARTMAPPAPGSSPLLLDPMGGVGSVGVLSQLGWRVVSSDLEPEWAAEAGRRGDCCALAADAARLPFRAGAFGAVVTSPAYGNRLADRYLPDSEARSHRVRRSYAIALGRPLSPTSSARVPWGAEYRALLTAAWAEVLRVLEPSGLFVLNVKDSLRTVRRRGRSVRELVPVSAWHCETLRALGFELREQITVPVAGDQNTNRARARGERVIDVENVYIWRAPALGVQLTLC